MRIIPIDCIKDGSSLSKTIYDMDGRVLLQAGVIVTEPIRNKLREWNITSACIIDEYSEYEINSIIKPELKEKAISIIKETFANAMRMHEANKITTNNYTSSEDELYIKSIHSLAGDLVDSLLSNNELMYSLVDIKTLDPYTYQHSVNVAINALVLGIGLKMDKSELLELCIAALLHDIGKVFISKEIITKKGPLTYKEYKLMQDHPQKGYLYLKNNKYISCNSRIAILQHHERVDGNGYPKGLRDNQIHIMARIICIADVYDALASDRCYRQAMCSSEAMEYIMSNSGIIFDFELVKLFARIFVPFPNGTKVFLSNCETAIVLDTLPNFPLRPNVLIVESSIPSRIGRKVSLINELSLVIKSSENPNVPI